MRFKHLFAMFALLLVFLLPGHLMASGIKADKNIAWLIFDYSPVFIVSGSQKGTGIIDGMEKYVKERLPNYQHTRSVSNIKRVLATLKNGRHGCASSLFWTPERAKIVEFSIPYLFVFPTRLIIRKDDLNSYKPYMNETGQVYLKRLLTESKLILGYAKSRSYSKTVDPLIAVYANKDNSLISYNEAVTKSLVKMLHGRRFDYGIAYNYELTQLLGDLGLDAKKFTTLGIAESNQPQFNYMGCPKNEWGQKVISEINAILKDGRSNPEFYDHYLRWMDETSIMEYNELIKIGFEKHSDKK
jgi:uncharacterized protein (TIGR02285 family)